MTDTSQTPPADRSRALAAFGQGGWRPTLGWSLIPCVLYAFIVGPLIRRPADAAELVALCGAAGVLIAARSFEKTRGVA